MRAQVFRWLRSSFIAWWPKKLTYYEGKIAQVISSLAFWAWFERGIYHMRDIYIDWGRSGYDFVGRLAAPYEAEARWVGARSDCADVVYLSHSVRLLCQADHIDLCSQLARMTVSARRSWIVEYYAVAHIEIYIYIYRVELGRSVEYVCTLLGEICLGIFESLKPCVFGRQAQQAAKEKRGM